MQNSSLLEFVNDSKKLQSIPLKAVQSYHKKNTLITKEVDARLTAEKEISTLIGNNPLQMMYDNHRHHGHFMATVFGLNGFELLARTLPWVYRAYSSHGFSYDYFPLELITWKKVIENEIPGTSCTEILAVYDWMIENHERVIELSQTTNESLPIADKWFEIKNSFLSNLLEGDHRKCTRLADQYLEATGSLKSLYMHIIQPVMYEVGQKWENAEISVAQEHLASAIIARIVAGLSNPPAPIEPAKNRVLVTATEGELHELGAWMISDLFQYRGWDIRYLGANTPISDLHSLLQDYLPQVLALSVTMPFNIMKTKNFIHEIKKDKLFDDLKILVGGRVFIDNPELYKTVGAQYFANNLEEVEQLIEQWEQSM